MVTNNVKDCCKECARLLQTSYRIVVTGLLQTMSPLPAKESALILVHYPVKTSSPLQSVEGQVKVYETHFLQIALRHYVLLYKFTTYIPTKRRKNQFERVFLIR